MFHSFVNPAERIVTIDREMTRTRYGVEATNQSTEVKAVSKGSEGRGRCRFGIISGSSEANNIQAVRSPDNDTG